MTGEKYNTGGGITPVEVYLIESLGEFFSPKNIYIIGNAFGWSTIVMSLAFRGAAIVALDAGIEGADNLMGINLTNQIALKNKLTCLVEYGFSPEKTKEVVEKHFHNEPLDFVFIDGLHTNEQLLKDFKGVVDFCHEDTVYLFHDVLNWKMQDSFEKIKPCLPNHEPRILFRTSSGMGVYIPKTLDRSIYDVFDAFTEPEKHIFDIKKTLAISWKLKSLIYRLTPPSVRRLAKNLIRNLQEDSHEL